jgi:hypothetical protein
VTAAAGALLFAFTVPGSADEHVSQSTAQAVNLKLAQGALTLAVSNPATSATSDGAATDGPNQAQPAISLLDGQSFLGAGALGEVAEANKDGSSYACSGVVSPGGQIQVGDGGNSCTVTGNGSGGVTLDLSKIPGLGGALSGVASMTLSADALTAHAYQNGTDPATGGASIAGLKLHVKLLGGLTEIVLPVDVPSGVNANLLTEVINAITGSSQLSLVADQISNALSGVVQMTSNWQQPIGDPGLEVSALHISLVNDQAATADLAHVTVGPNAPQAPTPVFSSQSLPLVLAVIALVGLGVVLIRRRLVAAPSQRGGHGGA